MDRYKVLEMIGEGSFGRVFKATERSTGATVALKLIPKVKADRTEKDEGHLARRRGI